LLWEEYKSAHPDGWQYSVFCEQYRRWLATQELVLRREYAPGDKLFVDYCVFRAMVNGVSTGW
jgi:transposase